MSWMARRDELGDRREPVELGNSVGSDVDAALTFKAGHGRVAHLPLDRAGSGRGARCGHRTPQREPLARKPIRVKPFTREFHCHRDFPTGCEVLRGMPRDHAYELMRNALKAVLPSVETSARMAKSTAAKKTL